MFGYHLIIETLVIICASIAIVSVMIGSGYMAGLLALFMTTMGCVDLLVALAVVARGFAEGNLDRFELAGVRR